MNQQNVNEVNNETARVNEVNNETIQVSDLEATNAAEIKGGGPMPQTREHILLARQVG